MTPEKSDATYRGYPKRKELGALLAVTGMITGMLPPPPGPFDLLLILGGLTILTPRTSGPVEAWARRRFPTAHRGCRAFVARLSADLQRRYPEPGSNEAGRDRPTVG